MNVALEHIGEGRVIGLSGSALDRLMPMHLWVSAANLIVRAGPTVTRLAGRKLDGLRLEDVVTLRRPRRVQSLDQLLCLEGVPLRLALNDVPDLSLKGMVTALPAGAGALLDLSLGISLIEAVGRFDLTLQDFAPTDLAVELLYLSEAKTAVTGELHRLARRIDGARMTAEVEAATDTLTGLGNRRRLDAALAELLDGGVPFALMRMDLDNFKQVNDTHGHAAGDAILRTVAHVLHGICRPQDIVTRIGGDEFVVVLVELCDPVTTRKIAERVIMRLESAAQTGPVGCRVSASLGVTFSTMHTAPDPERLLHEADVALYRSKRNGRGRATILREPLPDGPPQG